MFDPQSVQYLPDNASSYVLKERQQLMTLFKALEPGTVPW